MKIKNRSYSIKNLIFITPYSPSKTSTLNPLTPTTTGKLSTNYSNCNTNHRHIYKNIYKSHSKTESYNKNNFQTNNIHSLLINNKQRNKLFFKSFHNEKKFENNLLFSSKKSPNKICLKKNNLFFIPKNFQIHNLHRIIMDKNKASIILNQENELKNMKTIESNLTQEKGLYKYKMPINIFKTKRIKSKDITRNKGMNNIRISKTEQEKEQIMEINPIYLPKIISDKKLVFNLWKQDMVKYCDLTLEKNNENKIFRKNLLCVYN